MPRSFSSASSGFAATLVSTAVAASAFAQSYWRFEETVGFVVQDSGPNGLVGTLNAFPARVAEVAVDPVPYTDESNQRSLDLTLNDGLSRLRVFRDRGGDSWRFRARGECHLSCHDF